jgi:hypothetical protein
MFTNSDVPYLTNTLGFIMNSIACYSGNYDGNDDCFSERLITNNAYSAVDAIFNCRYGWGQPPSFGPSEHIDTTFFSIFVDDTLWIGVAQAQSVIHWRAAIWGGWGVWHYCGCELNLLGDPEVHGYTSVPIALQSTHSSQIQCGSQSFTVNVTNGSVPVDDALVCLYKDGEIHETGRTNASGQVVITINPRRFDHRGRYCREHDRERGERYLDQQHCGQRPCHHQLCLRREQPCEYQDVQCRGRVGE